MPRVRGNKEKDRRRSCCRPLMRMDLCKRRVCCALGRSTPFIPPSHVQRDNAMFLFFGVAHFFVSGLGRGVGAREILPRWLGGHSALLFYC